MTLRPLLRPGAVVLRSGPHHLRVGFSPGILVRDRPDLHRFLPLLDGVRDVDSLVDLVNERSLDVGDVRALVQELLALGAAVDPGRSSRGPRTLPVRVLAVDRFGHDLARAIRTVCGETHPRAAVTTPLVVAVCTGEPSRDALDDLVDRASGVLVVRIDEDRVRVGPLTVSGRTPCLRCADLVRAESEPHWPAVLAQLEHSLGPAVAPWLARHVLWGAAVHVAAEVEQWTTEQPPTSVGAVTTIGPGPADVERHRVPFHPACTCLVFPAA